MSNFCRGYCVKQVKPFLFHFWYCSGKYWLN